MHARDTPTDRKRANRNDLLHENSHGQSVRERSVQLKAVDAEQSFKLVDVVQVLFISSHYYFQCQD